MTKKIRIGDTVETLDDNISGTVTNISGDIITVLTEEGFELQYNSNELVKVKDKLLLKSSANPDADTIREKESLRPKSQPLAKSKKKFVPKFEVDLHIHQLTTSIKGMTKHDMLTLQLDTARRQLEFAIKKRMPYVVFIHGIGEGVLKLELQYLLGRYNNVAFYDADYKTYGLGATEVRIFQNKTS